MIDVAEAAPVPTVIKKPAPVVAPAPIPAAATGPSTTYGDPGFGFGVQERMADMVYAGGTPREIFDESAPYVTPTVTPDEPLDPIAVQMEKDRLQRIASEEAAAISRTRELDYARTSRQNNAKDTIAKTLGEYGLADLADYTYNEIIAKDITDPEAIIFKLRDQPAYQKRFAANPARLKAGLPELSPAEYIDLEDMYRTVIRSNGLPSGFYDTADDTRKLMEGTVSPAEFQRRIQDGYNAVANADPEVKRQFKELYGVTDSELAAYFLDPARGETILTTRARAAQIAARGAEQGGIQLSGQYAEELANRGFTEAQARTKFGEVGALGELKQTFAGETALSGEQLAGAAFGIDVASQQELERRKRLRVGEFGGGGSFARTTGETSGSISTSVGKAQ
jgi:hypothetical protein